MISAVLNLLIYISHLNFLSLDILHPLTLQNKMEGRRSARIRNIALGHTPRNALVVPSTGKRKASWDEEEQPKTNANAYSTSISVASDEALKDKFSIFPAEILQLILESVSTYPTMCPSHAYKSSG